MSAAPMVTDTARQKSLPETTSRARSKNRADSKRLLGLDLLRFFAVTMVVFAHLSLSGDSLSSRLLNPLHIAGWAGVTVFFVLSGFLISGLIFQEYQKTGGVQVKRFLIRRGWKIYPAFWVLYLFTLLAWDLGFWDTFAKRKLLGETLFLQNYFGGFWFNTWSLAVEEHFYFLFAAIVFLMLHFHRRRKTNDSTPFSFIPAVFVIMAIGCLAGRILGARGMTTNFAGWTMPASIVYPSHLRMDSLMFGVLVSYWWHFSPPEKFRNPVRRWRVPLFLLGLACLVPAAIWPPEQYKWVTVYGVMLFALGTGMLIVSLISFQRLERIPFFKQIGKLGTYSYSAYLWHGPLVVLGMDNLRKHFGASWNGGIDLLVCFSGTWILGFVAARIIEFPVLRLRERYCPTPVLNVSNTELDNSQTSRNLLPPKATDVGTTAASV